MQNAHYVKRSNMFLRFDERNCKVNCPVCNVVKGGNYEKYTEALEQEKKGIVDILESESSVVYKYSRSELIDKISEYKKEFFDIVAKKKIDY